MKMTVNLSGKASREAIDWINYVQFYARFKSPTGVYRIQTALDGEKTISIKEEISSLMDTLKLQMVFI
jgi:hypothetical protein